MAGINLFTGGIHYADTPQIYRPFIIYMKKFRFRSVRSGARGKDEFETFRPK